MRMPFALVNRAHVLAAHARAAPTAVSALRWASAACINLPTPRHSLTHLVGVDELLQVCDTVALHPHGRQHLRLDLLGAVSILERVDAAARCGVHAVDVRSGKASARMRLTTPRRAAHACAGACSGTCCACSHLPVVVLVGRGADGGNHGGAAVAAQAVLEQPARACEGAARGAKQLTQRRRAEHCMQAHHECKQRPGAAPRELAVAVRHICCRTHLILS